MIMVIDIKGVMLNEVLRKSFSLIVIRWSVNETEDIIDDKIDDDDDDDDAERSLA